MNILAIGCHPDDLDINCYGTLARCVKRGDNVTVATVSNGSLGHMVIMPDELAVIRKKEAAAAAKVIGAKEYVCLDQPDLAFTHYDDELIRKCTDLIRKVRPDMIITQYPDDYHRDHIETSHLVFDASFRASIKHYETEHEPFYDPIPLYYMTPTTIEGFPCEYYVDITDVIDIKMEAIAQHKSQLVWIKEHDNKDLLDTYRNLAANLGEHAGCAYAEAFALCKHRLPAKIQLPR